METRTRVRDVALMGGNAALDLIDTVGGELDRPVAPEDDFLRTYDDLVELGLKTETLSEAAARRLRRSAREHPRKADAALRRALEVRALLDSLFRPVAEGERPPADAPDSLRDLAAEAIVRGRLIHSGHGHFVWSWDDHPDLDAPVWPLPLAVPRHDEESQPPLVLDGGVRDRREDGALRGAPARAAREVLEPGAGADRSERGHRGREERPREDAAAAAVGHEQAEHDPADPVGPAEDQLGVLAEVADRHHQQRREHAHLGEAVEPDGLEVGHAQSTATCVRSQRSIASAGIGRASAKPWK